MSDYQFDGYVKVQQISGQGMISLRGDLSSTKLRKAIKDSIGHTVPAKMQISVKGDSGIAWMSPDEALIFAPQAELAAQYAALQKALKTTHALLVDVSDARCMFELKGPAVREVLAKVAPVDTSPTALKPGHIRRTRLAQVAGAFWLVDNKTARVVAFRSVTDYVAHLLNAVTSEGAQVFSG